MLREAKEVAVNVISTATVVGIGVAFLAGIGLILARESYRDLMGKNSSWKPEFWKKKKWPERVQSTLLGDDHFDSGTKK
jgi:hypothetical protein